MMSDGNEMNSSHEIQQIISQFGYKKLAHLQDLGHAPTDVGSSSAGSSDIAGILQRKGYGGPASGETFARGLMPGIEGLEGSSGICLSQNDAPGAMLHTFAYGAAPFHSLSRILDLESKELISAANQMVPNYTLQKHEETGQPIIYRTADLIAPSCGPAQEYFAILPGSGDYYQGYDVNASIREFIAGIPRTAGDDAGQYVSHTKDDILGIKTIDGYTEWIGWEGKTGAFPVEGKPETFNEYIYITSNIWYSSYHYALSEHTAYFVEGIGPYMQSSSFLAGNLIQDTNPTLHRVRFLASDTSMSIYKAGGARIDPAVWLFTMKGAYAEIIRNKGTISFNRMLGIDPAVAINTVGIDANSIFLSDIDPAGLAAVIAVKDNGTTVSKLPTEKNRCKNCGWTMDIEYNLTNLMGATGIDARNAAIEVIGGRPDLIDNKVTGFIASFTPGSPPIIYYPALFQRTGMMAGTDAPGETKLYFKRGYYPLPFSPFSFSVGVEVFGDTMVVSAKVGDEDLTVAIAPNLGVQLGWVTLEGGFQNNICELDPNVQLNVSRASGAFSWRPAVYKSWNGNQGMFEYEISHISADAQLNNTSIVYNPMIDPNAEEIKARYKVTPHLVGMQINDTPVEIDTKSLINYEFSVTPPDVIPDARSIDGKHRLALEVRALKTIDSFNSNQNADHYWSKPNISTAGMNNIQVSELLNDNIQSKWGFGFIGGSSSIASIRGMFGTERDLKFIKRPIPCIMLWADTWANSQAIHIWPNKLPQEWISMVSSNIQNNMKKDNNFSNISLEKDIQSISITAEINNLIVKKIYTIKIINPNPNILSYINHIKSTNDGYGHIKIYLKDEDSNVSKPNKIHIDGFVTSLDLSNTHSGTEITISMQDPFSLMMEKLIYPATHSVDGWSPRVALEYLLYRTGLKVDISDLIDILNTNNGYLSVINRIGRYIATDFNAASQQFSASTLGTNLATACGPILYYHYPIFYWDEEQESIIGTTLDYHLLTKSNLENTVEISNNFSNRLLTDNTFSYTLNNDEIKYNVYIKTQDRFRGSPMWTAIGAPEDNAADGYKSSKIFDASGFVQVAEHMHALKIRLEEIFIPYAIKPSTSLSVSGLPLALPRDKYNFNFFCGLMGIGSKLPNFVLPSLVDTNLSVPQWHDWMYANKTRILWDASGGNYIQSAIDYKALKSPLEDIETPFGISGGS